MGSEVGRAPGRWGVPQVTGKRGERILGRERDTQELVCGEAGSGVLGPHDVGTHVGRCWVLGPGFGPKGSPPTPEGLTLNHAGLSTQIHSLRPWFQFFLPQELGV